MVIGIKSALSIALGFALSIPSCISFGQTTSGIDGASFAKTNLQMIMLMSPTDRRNARELFGKQIALLDEVQRVAATTVLLASLRADDPRTRGDILAVLARTPSPWVTQDTNADSQYIYSAFQQAKDETNRRDFDAALANARGLYRDGISDFNSSSLDQFRTGAYKLKAMVQEYPKSAYAENASFYVGQYYTKAFFLTPSAGIASIKTANSSFEDYITKAERGDFSKRDFLAAGYYFRGLNGWIAGDIADALKWLNRGLQKFTDGDTVYVYQLFFSLESRTVLDKYFPAKSLFATTVDFLKGTPPGSSAIRPDALIAKLAQL